MPKTKTCSKEELNSRLPDLERIAEKLSKDQLSQDTPVDVTEIVNEEYPFDPFELLGENDITGPKQIPVEEVGTPIQEFFRDATVLITGGTGFMGKALTEKLVRGCPHLKRIYLLIRPKKNKEPRERLKDIFEERLFLRVKSEVPDFRSKISVILGDVGAPDLGLSPTDRVLLTGTVNMIFHGAATVRFDENIKTAVGINTRGVQAMLTLAREMEHLKSFVHVSTAFSHCPRQEIHETFYPVPHNYNHIIQLVMSRSDRGLEALTRALVDTWPNTYTFTKALAEDVIKNEAADLPISVVRPSIIISTYQEPVRGWIDNPYGPVGMLVGVGSGVIHASLNKVDNVIDLMPIDVVVNALLAAAWYRGSSNHQSIPIYNLVSTAQNPIRCIDFTSKAQRHLYKWPALQSLWYISYIETQFRLVYLFLNFFLHVIPGLLLDSVLALSGQKPILTKIYNKLEKAQFTLVYFAFRRWTWRNDNTQHLWTQLSVADRKLFFFDVAQLDWDYLCEALSLGLRVNLVKDGLHTLPAARRKWQRLRIAHCVLKLSFFTLLASLLYSYLSSQVLLAIIIVTSLLAALMYLAAVVTTDEQCDAGADQVAAS